MYQINITALDQLSPEELRKQVEMLAKDIEAGKRLTHEDSLTNQCFLNVFDRESASELSITVVEDLNALLKRSIEKGLDADIKKQLDTIRMLRDTILAQNPLHSVPLLDDNILEILSKLPPCESGRLRTVEIRWDKIAAQAQIRSINDKRFPFQQALKGMNAKQITEWLVTHPFCQQLEKDALPTQLGFLLSGLK